MFYCLAIDFVIGKLQKRLLVKSAVPATIHAAHRFSVPGNRYKRRLWRKCKEKVK